MTKQLSLHGGAAVLDRPQSQFTPSAHRQRLSSTIVAGDEDDDEDDDDWSDRPADDEEDEDE